MSVWQIYWWIACSYFCYSYGIMVGMNRGGWRDAVACWALGAIWPAAFAYGFYLHYFKRKAQEK